MALGDVASADCCLQRTLRWWWEHEEQRDSWESDELRSYQGLLEILIRTHF